jgi:acetyl-CoA carboxylase biotin carboxyl carrier protein
VADEAPEHPGPFDVKTIRLLVALMSRNDLSEIDLRNGEQRIRLRRGPQPASAPPAVFAPVAAPVAAPPLASAAPTPKTDGEPAKDAKKPTIPIKSPTPGTFYVAPKPGTPPYVQVGDRVSPTTVVCIIEAMKILNEITADCTGVVTEIMAENGQAVEYGQVLFNVDPTG